MNDPGSQAGVQVLIVDDNVDTTDSMAMLLEMAGHRVETAQDGRSALEAASRRRPDVVLLDVGLPDISGLELARRLRQAIEGRLSIIGISGHGRDQDHLAARQAGIDLYLVKPVDPGRIVALVESAGKAGNGD
ncbi:MAG TPA: response regulator [Burkholderiaceae bacterium]|nr:response regulator [Burkholderiaceae bacterium]